MSTSEKDKELSNESLSKISRSDGKSLFLKSTTIGLNGSIEKEAKENIPMESKNITTKTKKSPHKSENISHQQVVEKLSHMDINDLNSLQQKIYEQNKQKMIEIQVRQKLEEKRAEEIKKYKEIKSNIELMLKEAERKHQLKIQAFNEQIQAELEKEKQKELAYQEQRKALAANTKKIQEQKERQLKEQIKKYDDVFSKQESAFLKIIQSCNPEMAKLLDSFKKELKDIKNFKESQGNSLDGYKMSCIKLDGLYLNLQKEIREFEAALLAKESEEKLKAQIEAEAKKKEVIIPKQIVAVTPRYHDQPDQPNVQDSTSQSENFRIYSHYRTLLLSKKENIKTLDDAPELQQLRFALKYAINNAINLLNENNRTTLVDGCQKLCNLLSGQRVNTSVGSVAITDHNQVPDWCRLRIAEKIIDRCDKTPGIQFFAAALTLALWQKFPDFGEIFKAILYKECPFLIPFKPPKFKNMTNEEFQSSWGYRLTNGICEERSMFEVRTSKFASLLAAVWISFPRKGDNEVSPCDIKEGWKYFAKILNSHPDVEYLHIIGKILEVSGFMLHQIYGNQFVKMMVLIRDSYIPMVQSSVDEETSGSFSRLKDIVGKFFTEKKFTEPKGRLSLGYW